MRLSRLILLAAVIAPMLVAQTDADRRRLQEIQARHNRGEQISAEDMTWAKAMMAKTREQQKAATEKFVKEHPPQDSTGLVPLPDLGTGTYKGEEGGLYPGGGNTPPPAHLKAGMKIAQSIVPLDADGRPSSNGKIVLLSVGMSNTTMEFQVFQKDAAADSSLNPRVVILDGAQGGQTARVTANPSANYWKVDAERTEKAGVTARQVQVAWIKQANARPTEGFPEAAKILAKDVVETLHNLQDKFPNIKIAYLSSRIYGGYATSALNPEPYAYEGAFSMKWVIAGQIAGKPELNYDPAKGAVRSPWIAWGPYIWTDGVKGRKTDSVVWLKNDVVESDRTHPSDSGREKVAQMLLGFLKTDPTARVWFVKQ